jgi:hypothetical protein
MISDIDLYEVKHLKLSTGEEVLAEIIEETEYDLVVKRALRLQTDIANDRTRYHSFRPFMTYQDDPEIYSLIKTLHVVAITYPAPAMLRQYQASVNEVEKLRAEMEEETTEQLEKIMKQMEDNVKENTGLKDSDGSNVLPFPTIH